MNSPLIRLVLAISLDGRISLESDVKTHLGSSGDRRVLEEALAWSDATLMGSGTLRTHEATCLIHNKELLKNRSIAGKSSQPVSLIVSNAKDFSNQLTFFKQPIKRWLLTKEKVLENEIPPKNFHKLLQMKGSWSETLNTIKEHGISNIVLLGGTALVSSLLSEDKIDELQLTLTPKILGGGVPWTSYGGPNLPKGLRERNAWILNKKEGLGDNEILLRYSRNRNASKS